MADSSEVIILGGGLAGLTLALQLRRTRPETSIVVLEKRAGPAPEAAFKVGESTVEVGAQYFARRAGMRDHLHNDHIFKFGLRYYLTRDGNADIAQRIEIGAPFEPKIKAFQIDRGIFENELARRAREEGIDVRDDARVEEVEIGGDEHVVRYTRGGSEESVSGRWVVDAAGRASILKRKFGLGHDVDHDINSSWFRLADRLKVDDWSDDEAWTAKPQHGNRWRSTNHLMGEGYWVWLIPLSSGSTSIGIVADPRFHPFDGFDTLEKALAWIKDHEPQLFEKLDGREDEIQDFKKVARYSYGVERVYSPDRWALTGEAGAFLDPFYSPGSDFIAYSNTLLNDIITRELDGEDVAERIEVLNDYYLRHFTVFLTTYQDQYVVFGNPQVMMGKVYAELVLYWASPACIMFFQEGLADLELHRDVADLHRRYNELLPRFERLLLEGHELGATFSLEGLSIPLVLHDILDGEYDHEGLRACLNEMMLLCEGVVMILFRNAAASIGIEIDEDRRMVPERLTLHQDKWESEGMFADDGMTMKEAREHADLGAPLPPQMINVG